MAPFRDADHSQLAAFKTHVSIAESLLDVVADFGARLRVQGDPELQTQRGESWRDLWMQLDQAREIAATSGRDSSAFDQVRASIGNVHLAAAGMQRISPEMLANAGTAIQALRMAVPEVVIPVSPHSEYRNPVRYVSARSFENPAVRWSLVTWLLVIVAAVIVIKSV